MKELPGHFHQAIRSQLGNSFDAFLMSLEERPPVSVRLHPLKNHPWQELRGVPWCTHGRYLETRPTFTLDPLFHAGTYYVQEASSMFLEQALRVSVDLSQPLKILDLCAAPGGKSTHLLALMNGQGLLVANEANRGRANVLSENIQKWGYSNCVVTHNQAADFSRLPGFFDVVVLDAPCSGEGLFRKDDAAIGEWSPQNVHMCALRQRRILSDAWDALREGGIMVYSTCTYNPIENEQNLLWLYEQQDVEFLHAAVDDAWGIEEVKLKGVVGYRFFPHRVRGEGFFLAIVRKLGRAQRGEGKATHKFSDPPTKAIAALREWTVPTTSPTYYQFKEHVFFLPSAVAPYAEYVMDRMHVIYAGTTAATLKGDKLIPAQALATSVELNRDRFVCVDADEATSLRYLRRETLAPYDIPKGFALLTFRGTPLGWINALPNRVNNLYPAEWRIRMELRK